MPATEGPSLTDPLRGTGRGVWIWRVCTTALAVAILCLQLAILLRTASAVPPSAGVAAAVFVDDRGRPVYPYVIREVQNTVSKNASTLQKCYLDYLARSPQVRDGRMTYDWYVTADGRADRVELVSGTLGDDEMKADVRDAVLRFRFPPPGERTYVEYTFSFKDVTQTEPASK